MTLRIAKTRLSTTFGTRQAEQQPLTSEDGAHLHDRLMTSNDIDTEAGATLDALAVHSEQAIDAAAARTVQLLVVFASLEARVPQ